MSSQDFKFALPKNLKELLQKKRMSVVKLSSLASVPTKTIYGWQAGSPPRNLEDLYSVAKVLGVSIEELSFSLHNTSDDSDQWMRFGAWLKLSRERVRLTVLEASGRLNIKPQQLNEIETIGILPVDVLWEMGKVYQLDREVLIAMLTAVGK